jgi:hypothetical protein
VINSSLIEKIQKKMEETPEANQTNVQDVQPARAAGELMACPMCDDEDNPSFLPEEMLPCPRGHYYCKICIAKLANQAVKLSRTPLKCMSLNCDQCFSVSTIRQVLPLTFWWLL